MVSWVGRKFLQFRQVHSIPVLDCSFIICFCLLLGKSFVSGVEVTPVEEKFADFTLPRLIVINYITLFLFESRATRGGAGGGGDLTTVSTYRNR